MIKVYSTRGVETWPSWHLVWEWEDIIAKVNGWSLITDNVLFRKIRKKFPFLKLSGLPKSPVFIYEMGYERFSEENKYNRFNKRNVFPCIIDYFLKDENLSLFEKQYSEHQKVFVSSKEVYDRLKNLGINLPIYHLPLSLPDYYKINDSSFLNWTTREYDVVLVGRQNTILKQYLENYARTHTSFVYVVEDERKDRKFHYYTSKGEYVGYYYSRTQYMSLLSKSKVAMYATPGIDGGEKRTNGYNQVTPKFLEYIASGCNIIARWADNADTDYYHIKDFSDNIQSYQQFEYAMDRALTTKPDACFYANYLSSHYTSKRAEQLKQHIESI